MRAEFKISLALAVSVNLGFAFSPSFVFAKSSKRRPAPVAKKVTPSKKPPTASISETHTNSTLILPPGLIALTNSNSLDDKLNAVLKFVSDNEAQKHGWPANYKSLWCPTNVFNLLRRLEQAQVDFSRAKVWYIVPSDATQNLHPKAARSGTAGAVNEWSFHVVIEIDGRILDLDYTDRPEVASLPAYAAAMWQKGPLVVKPDQQPLYVREIPAADYLNRYSGNYSWFLGGADGRYPAAELTTLL